MPLDCIATVQVHIICANRAVAVEYLCQTFPEMQTQRTSVLYRLSAAAVLLLRIQRVACEHAVHIFDTAVIVVVVATITDTVAITHTAAAQSALKKMTSPAIWKVRINEEENPSKNYAKNDIKQCSPAYLRKLWIQKIWVAARFVPLWAH